VRYAAPAVPGLLIASPGPDGPGRIREACVTTAETLRAEGFAEGVAEVLVHMLTMNVHPVPENVAEAVHKIVRQAVRDMTVDELKVWMARTAAARTPEEIAEIFG
jgi:hypothetical protein